MVKSEKKFIESKDIRVGIKSDLQLIHKIPSITDIKYIPKLIVLQCYFIIILDFLSENTL